MRITESSDWRNSIPFETPVLVADLIPGEPTRCAGCGAAGEPLPRTALWAYKHRHPNNHSGYVRFYCRAHTPAVARVAPTRPERAARTPRRAAPRVPEAPRAMCPDCFVEVPTTGVCGMCGQRVV